MHNIVRLVFGIVLLATAACSSSRGPIVSTGPRYDVSATDMAVYRLAAGDKLRLTVYNEATLSGEFQVGSDGNISFPLIGEIPADGKAPSEVATAIQTKLADGYLREPRVSAEVIGYRPFFILGEVSSPGQYPFAAGMTAMNAVATAEGFTPRADTHVAYIRRAGSSKEEVFQLSPDLRIFPGDTIRIRERFF